ncbi:hypothetical protein QBC44DRAFT_399966 [Cladorrhinum sp. PSN332]|nr:hypothetical protein QBC44DRAFT_399966 [Cladorrhinum sp. PSN332]
MASHQADREPNVPENLFHTTLTVIDYHKDPSGAIRSVYVLGTHTDLPSAKRFALSALQFLNYDPSDFAAYATRPTTDEDAAGNWPHGPGVLVYARAPAGQELLVGLDTKANTCNFPAGGPDGTPLLPKDAECGHLHYVLQSQTDYNQDKSGASQSTEIEGCYVSRADALAAAKGLLSDQKDEFAQYDERDDAKPNEDWPFGEDAIVHAVAHTGENYEVAVKTSPGARGRVNLGQ